MSLVGKETPQNAIESNDLTTKIEETTLSCRIEEETSLQLNHRTSLRKKLLKTKKRNASEHD